MFETKKMEVLQDHISSTTIDFLRHLVAGACLGAAVLHHRRSPIVHTGRSGRSCTATTTAIPPIPIPDQHHPVHLPLMVKAGAAATRGPTARLTIVQR